MKKSIAIIAFLVLALMMSTDVVFAHSPTGTTTTTATPAEPGGTLAADDTPPVFVVATLSPRDGAVYGAPISTIQAGVNDLESGVTSVVASIDGTAYAMQLRYGNAYQGAWYWTLATPISAEGQHSITYVATNVVGLPATYTGSFSFSTVIARALLVGVDYWSGNTRSMFTSRDLPFMNECGLKYLRLEFGTDKLKNLDSLVPEVTSRGYKVIGVLIRKDLAKTNDVNAWGTWVYNTVNRYKAHVKVWECWNEPSWNTGFGAPGDPVRYTTFLKMAYTKAKAADPSCKVLGGSILGTTYNAQNFLKAMYKNGAKNYMDALACHPYCNPLSPLSPSVSRSGNAFWKLQVLRDIMNSNGDTSKNIWITEVGWSTDSTGVTEDKQALYLKQALDLAKSWGWVETFIIYNWQDGGGFTFGLLRDRSISPKPSFYAVKNFIRG